jgi:hypothetical protein
LSTQDRLRGRRRPFFQHLRTPMLELVLALKPDENM